jgi:FixJ family two-component response regulator
MNDDFIPEPEKKPVHQQIFIIDDDEAVRDSIALLLKSEGYLVKTYESGIRFLEEVSPYTPGCIVVDIRMPSMTGLELADELNNRNTSMPILFITGHGDVPMAVEAMKKGALEFIQKPFDDQELIDKVDEALNIDAENRHVNAKRDEIRDRLEQLTPRENQVLDMILNGMANKVIAIELELSQRTVEIHRARVMEKMEAKSLAGLVQMVIMVRGVS